MNCDETYPLLDAYADGELDVVSSLGVERHLKTCAACAEGVRSIQSLHSAFRRSDLAARAPDALRNRIRRAIHGSGSEEQSRARVHWLWQWLAIGATAFAALALLMRPGGISSRDQLAEEAIGSHVRSLMADHLTDVASSDQHTVKPWFNGKINFAPQVTDFAPQGFPLVGGRLDYLSGQTVAVLVYKRNQHLINVFIWPAKQLLPQDTGLRRGYAIVNRDFNGMHYCIVSDLNPRELDEFAALLTGQSPQSR